MPQPRALLEEHETNILSSSPMEKLDVLGLYYMPKDGVEKWLPAVVLRASTVLETYLLKRSGQKIQAGLGLRGTPQI